MAYHIGEALDSVVQLTHHLMQYLELGHATIILWLQELFPLVYVGEVVLGGLSDTWQKLRTPTSQLIGYGCNDCTLKAAPGNNFWKNERCSE